MVRFARVVAVGYPHHVTHRGNRRDDVFLAPEDHERYLGFVGQYARAARLELWGYCLMTNHVHLIVVPRRADSLARGIGLAHRRYAAWLNRRERWSGHVWANRFFSAPLDEAHQWMAIRYVERNPVRAGIVSEACTYAWSAARAHGLGQPDALLAPGRPFPGLVEDWQAWLRDPEEEAMADRLRRATHTGRPCGETGFVRMLEKKLGRRLRPRRRGPKPKPGEEEGQLDVLERAS